MKVSVGGLGHDDTARASAPSSVWLSRTSLCGTFNCEAGGYNSIRKRIISRPKSQDTFHLIPFVALSTILSKGKNVVRVWR